MASVLEQTGREEDALKEISKALAIDPSDPRTLVRQAQIYSRLNRWVEAEQTFRNERPNFDPGGDDKKTKPSIGPPPTVMHVGPCTGCTKAPISSKGVASPRSNPIVLDCESDKKSRARPSSVTVTSGDPISWTLAAGSYSTTFTVMLPPGICSDQATTITSESDSCTAKAATGQPMDYDIDISSCTGGKGKGSILINPQ
jgi:hypothetical protein